MEHFPLRDIRYNLREFSELESLEMEIEGIHNKMKESRTDSEFGVHRTKWQMAQRKQDKLKNCSYRLVYSIIESLKLFHEQNLVHLDIKGIAICIWYIQLAIIIVQYHHFLEYNILLRKTCKHKDKLICECDSPPFNVLIGDFDYCHEVETTVSSPDNKGTKGYRALSVS